MRRLLVASTVILTASVPQFAQAMTVEQYLAITRDQVPDQPPESVFPYLTGVLDGLLMLNQFNGDEGEPLFCMPAGEEIEIIFAIFDIGDPELDSAVVLDGVHWGCTDLPPVTAPTG